MGGGVAKRASISVLVAWSCHLQRSRQANSLGRAVCVQVYANAKGIKIIGDMPIYVGGQSADVWANR
jgi:hypothetical protein